MIFAPHNITPLLAEEKTSEKAVDWAADVLNFLQAHIPYFPWILLVVLIGLAALSIYLGHRLKVKQVTADQAVVAERDEAKEELAVAEAALAEVNLNAEVLSLILKTCESSVTRANRYGATPTTEQRTGALQYLCEWTGKIFGFGKPDINKVTLWVPSPDSQTLRVRAFSGMSPDSAQALKPPVNPPDTKDLTFAAMAYKNGRVEVCHDVGTDPRYKQLDRPPRHPYKAILAAPVKRGAAVVGSFTVDSLMPNKFADSEQPKQGEVGIQAQQTAELLASLFALFLE